MIFDLLINFNRAFFQADWVADSGGEATLDYRRFYNAFFELADLWCPHIDANEYAQFLNFYAYLLSKTSETKEFEF